MYQGTEIDWPLFDPDRMEVRGKNINELIGTIDPVTMLYFILNGAFPDQRERCECESAVLHGFHSVRPGHPAWETAFQSRRQGANVPCAMIAGLATGTAEIAKTSAEFGEAIDGLPDACEGWIFFGALPAILCAAAGRDLPAGEAGEGQTFSAVLSDLVVNGPQASGDTFRKALDAVLVSMEGGYGYLTPTVMLPRIAAGTRADLAVCLIAGLCGSGHAHVGSIDNGIQMLNDLRENHGVPDRQRTVDLLDAWSSEYGRIPGFGHALFRRDPRVPRLRDYLRHIGFDTAPLRHHDLLCEIMLERYGLCPNTDSVTAAVLAGSNMPKDFAAGLFLCMRAAAMMAHVFEKRRFPRFGVTSATARGFLHKLPVGWI